MEEFKELQNSWLDQVPNQPNEQSYNSILKGVALVSKSYKGNQLILFITAVGLIVFAISVSGFTTTITATGFSLMIGCLLVRIAFEALHNYKLRNFNIATSSRKLQEDLMSHYRQRKWVHFVITPLCLVSYGIGFYLLLPTFKMNLSEGLYAYILISGAVFFVLLVILLIYVITKETKQHQLIQSYF